MARESARRAEAALPAALAAIDWTGRQLVRLEWNGSEWAEVTPRGE